MKYEFLADQINIGDDDAEEVYTVEFVDSGTHNGAPANYLLFQRSVAGIGDPELREPYMELNDPANGRFAGMVKQGELLPTYLHLVLDPGANVSTYPDLDGLLVDEIVVKFEADGALLRKLKYAMELVIGDGFEWRSLA